MKDSVISIEATSHGKTETLIKTKDFTYVIDEPVIFGGNNKAPSPVEYLLGATAGCVVAIGSFVAKEMGFEIAKLNMTVTGHINSSNFLGISDEMPSGFKEIIITLDLDSSATQEQLERWEQQVKKRCPVIDNLEHAADVVIKTKTINA